MLLRLKKGAIFSLHPPLFFLVWIGKLFHQVLRGVGLPPPDSHANRRDGEAPAVGRQIANSGRVQKALEDYISAKTEATIAAELAARKQALQPQARNQLAATQSKADSKLAKAEAKLAKTIEKEITDKLPDSPVSASKSWVDPFFGFRGRYLLSDHWYLAARGDIGGFGVSSQLTWNAYAGLGVELNKRIAMELGIAI